MTTRLRWRWGYIITSILIGVVVGALATWALDIYLGLA